MDRAWEMQNARDQAILAAIAAEKGIAPDALNTMIDDAVAAHAPNPDEVVSAQRDLIEAAVRDVMPEEQADRIVEKILEKLNGE